MARGPITEDRNFDDLAERFNRNVYGGQKGRIRLAVLRRDLGRHLPVPPYVPGTGGRPWRILDAGGGEGRLSLPLAQSGHSVTLCDLSRTMLGLAERRAAELGVPDRVRLLHCPIQDLEEALGTDDEGFDLVLCHAVLEWLREPRAGLDRLVRRLRPGGYLSLCYYNLHGAAYRKLLRGQFRDLWRGEFSGDRGSLSPSHPLDPEQVARWLTAYSLEPVCFSGIRVFHDYMPDPAVRERDPDQLLELELALSQREPYRSLGRYQHRLLRLVNQGG